MKVHYLKVRKKFINAISIGDKHTNIVYLLTKEER